MPVFDPSLQTVQWKPNMLCHSSARTYAREAWSPDTRIDENSAHTIRATEKEESGSFRAIGVLMGVIYIVGL